MDLFDSSSKYYYKNIQRRLDKEASQTEKAYKTNKSKIDIPQVADLNRKLNSLCMVVEALSELLEDHGITKDIIENKVEEIDLRDGILDGQNVPISSCTKCGRKTKSQNPICMYCGGKLCAT